MKDNIKMDLGEMILESVDLIGLVQDRDQCSAIVPSAMYCVIFCN
jgi:hypothetical protein